MEPKELFLEALTWLGLITMGTGIGIALTSDSTITPEEQKKQGNNILITGGVIFVASQILK